MLTASAIPNCKAFANFQPRQIEMIAGGSPSFTFRSLTSGVFAGTLTELWRNTRSLVLSTKSKLQVHQLTGTSTGND